MGKLLRVGVIGYGYWGPNLVRNFYLNRNAKVHVVCDTSAAQLERVKALYPAVEVTRTAADLIRNPVVDAVVIATPVATHFELAMEALKAGKHVLVEKPIATLSEQAIRLIEEASRRELVLMVDHTFCYTGAVRKMREIVHSIAFGDVQYYDSARVNLGIFQHDVNVLWDLAVHDLSIMNHVLQARPIAVSAVGHSHIAGQPQNMACLTVFFAQNLIAHINVNWLSPVKIRRTLIGGSKQMIVFDDLETSEKLKIYDKGITVTETPDDIRKLLISYRTGDLWSPKVSDSEALQVEVEHFIDCVFGKKPPMTGGKEGLDVVHLLEAADRSIAARGAPVDL
jgi:predicted dehydrogenase